MRSPLILALVAVLVFGACGRFATGEAEPDEPAAVGSGVQLGDPHAGDAVPDTAAGPAAGSPAPDPAQPSAPPQDSSHHPRTPSGELMLNTTVREVDGLVLQLSVNELEGMPGSLLFDLLIGNERDTDLFYDPTYGDAIVITDTQGNRVWSVSECDLQADADWGHPTLKAGDDTMLTFRYDSDGNGDPACVVPPGDYEARATFAWCHPENHHGGECRELATSQGHPLPIRFAGG